MSRRYLTEAPHEEAMDHWTRRGGQAPIQGHRVWTFDFMAVASHDIPCMVCFDARAVIERNVTPGQYNQTIQPCRACQTLGWRMARQSWLRRLLDRLAP